MNSIVIIKYLCVWAFSFIAPCFLFGILDHLLSIRQKVWAKVILFIGCFFLVQMVIFIGDVDNLPGTFAGFMAAVLLCCRGSLLQRISFSIILAGIAFSFNALADSYGPIEVARILRTVMWALVYAAVKRLAPKREYNLPSALWVLVDLLTLTPFTAILVTVLLSDIDRSHPKVGAILLLSLVWVSSFGVLWAVAVLAKQHKLEQEEALFKINQTYYQNLEQEQFQVRRLRHDMANHFQAMAALPDAEMRSYLEQLIEFPAMSHARSFCENRVVNAVLSAKQLRMEQSGIELTATASLPAALPVEAADLCAVFANSLDNAIEACEKLPAGERRVTVRARADKGLFALQVQNPMKGDLKKKGGFFVTTKGDAAAHGFGLKSIREIAARYSGSFELTAEGGQFMLVLYLPI